MRPMRNLEPTKGSLVFVTAASVVALLLCVVVGTLGLSQVRAARADLEEKRAQVEDGRQYAKRLQDSERRYFQALDDLKHLEKSASTRAYIPTLLKQLEQTALSVNLKVTAVRPIVEAKRATPRKTEGEDGDKGDAAAKKEEKPPYAGQKIEVKCEGTYANALSFLYRLTTFPKILTVNSVAMAPATSSRLPGMNSNRLEVTFNLTAFVLDEPKAADIDAGQAGVIGGHKKDVEDFQKSSTKDGPSGQERREDN